MKSLTIIIVIVYLSTTTAHTVISAPQNYEPNWDSLDTRPIPSWYDEAKFGIFLHWGLYAVPSFGSEWFWADWKGKNQRFVDFMNKNYPPGFTYQDFAPKFTAEFYDPKEWAKLFEKAGAKYVVLTSKHHEGFTMWPSKYSFSWNAMDVGPHRDLLGDLASAVRNYTNMKFGVYHSLYEWFNPLYQADKASNFSQFEFVLKKAIPEMVELVQKYKPEVLWSDGDWEASDTYWKSTEFLAWLYNQSPVKDTILVNDRWGIGIPCHHGDFYSCADRFNPGVLQKHKWENAMTVDKNSWGYRRDATMDDFLSTHELIQTMVETVSCGGNILMNVGPTLDGRIPHIFQERLLDMGKWLKINGEAIYASKPWKYQNDTNGYTWYTSKDKAVYAINLKWPEKNTLNLGLASDIFKTNTIVNLLGDGRKLKWNVNRKNITVNFPDKATVNSDWVYVLKIAN